MLITELCFVISLIVFAQETESKVYFLRDYDNTPTFIDLEEKDAHNNQQSSTKYDSRTYKPKKTRSKHAVLHYGRHIYHLDNFDDLTKLRSKLTPDYISYDYFDINDLFRSNDPARSIPWDYVQNMLFLSPSPNADLNCAGKSCEDNMRKYNELYKQKHRKRYRDSVERYGNRKPLLGSSKRFKIVDNTKSSKSKAMRKPSTQKDNSVSSEEHKKRQSKSVYAKKKQPITDSSSSEENNKWSGSYEKHEKWQRNKNKKHFELSNKRSSEESAEYTTTKKPKRKHDFDSNSESWENKWDKFESNSIEKSLEKKKQKKKKSGSSNGTKRKKFDNDETYLQGNRLISANDMNDDDHYDKRRRLPHFLPKRFHWDPSEIHDLGYFWFNGPKGRYPSPVPLN